jgi:hypothetical protein
MTQTSKEHRRDNEELSSHHRAFLEHLEQVCRMFLALYFCQDDPPDPTSFLWLFDLEESLLSFLPPDFRETVDQLAELPLPDSLRPLDREATHVFWNLRSSLIEWFELAGYDYEHIPPPESLSAEKVKLPGGFNEKKTAYRFGHQIIWIGSSGRRRGWAELYRASDGKRICSFRPPTSEICWNKHVTEMVWQIAAELSRLTDWNILESQPIKVQRAIGKRVFQIAEPLRSYFRIN